MRVTNWLFATADKMRTSAETTDDDKRRDKLNRFAHNLEQTEELLENMRAHVRRLHAEKMYLESELKRTQTELFKHTK